MRRTHHTLTVWGLLIVTVSVLLMAGAGRVSAAADPAPVRAECIKVDGIDRFARIDTDVYRGDSPSDAGLRALAREHVKTLICLRNDVPYRKTAEELGMRIVHMPFSALDVPDRQVIRRFLEIATDPAAKPVFFHCRFGEDRTGLMAAVYRMQVQGWSEEAALEEMKEFGFSRLFVDLKNFVSSYREAWSKASPHVLDRDAQAEVERAMDLTAAGQTAEAFSRLQAVLQKNQESCTVRLGLASALARSGKVAEALAEVRQAVIFARSRDERIAVARGAIHILSDASERGDVPGYSFDMAEREWSVLELLRAEDQESLIKLGGVFQRGFNLSRSLEAFDRARLLGEFPGKDLAACVERIRAVRSYVPRTDLGKRLGLMPKVNRGELSALLIQELRVDRLREQRGSPTWRPYLEQKDPPPAVPDIRDSPHQTDIRMVLQLGVRGLEPFSDGTFRPSEVVSRAEFVVVVEDVLTRATRDQTLPTRLLGQTSRFDDIEAGAWYQSAADLARSMGLFVPVPGEAPHFKPLDAVTGLDVLQGFRLLRRSLDTKSRAIVVVVDALRAESLSDALAAGRLPNLIRLSRERGVVRFEKCLSALPSVTLPNHTTIFTGVYPAKHGVPGNEWFDRTLAAAEPLAKRRREYVKYGSEDDPGLGRAWSFGGIPLHDRDLSPAVRTLYEAYREAETERGRETRTAAVFDPVRRGADRVVNPNAVDALITLNILPFVNQFAWLDRSAMKKAIALLKDDNPPELMGIWLPGLDGWSHAYGPGPVGSAEDRQAKYMADTVDPLIGELSTALEERGLLDETVIFLTADHGHSDTVGESRYAVDAENVYRLFVGSPYRPPLGTDGRLDESSRDFDVVVMANSNGNAALVSVRTPGRDWKTPPARADLEAVANTMLKEPYVSRIFFLDPHPPGAEPGMIMLSRGAGGATVTNLRQDSEERIVSRALGLAGSGRSGDLLIEARGPYFFAPRGSVYLGQHGRRDRLEDHVPLMIINPPGGRRHAVKSVVEIADIAPTVAGTLGFLEALPADGKDLLAPPRIVISSHGEDQHVPAGQPVSILGFARDSVGIQRVEFRVGEEGGFNLAKGADFWEARVLLPSGRHAIVVRAVDETGLQSTERFHLIAE